MGHVEQVDDVLRFVSLSSFLVDEHIIVYGHTLGHWATMSSILIWKMSWDIFSPKGTCKNLYLLRWVLNVVRSDTSSIRYILKKALLPSTLENLVASVRTWAISSRVGALWFSQMITLFRSLGQGIFSACHLPS